MSNRILAANLAALHRLFLASSAARVEIATSIRFVILPVNVLRWLGWRSPSAVGPLVPRPLHGARTRDTDGRRTCAARRLAHTRRGRRWHGTSQCPPARGTGLRQRSRSAVVCLFFGGTQRTTEVSRVLSSFNPSRHDHDVLTAAQFRRLSRTRSRRRATPVTAIGLARSRCSAARHRSRCPSGRRSSANGAGCGHRRQA